MSIPAAPTLGYSFTSNSTNNPTSQQPGVQLDAEFNRGYAALSSLISAIQISLNTDGTLKSSAVQAAYDAGSVSGGTGTNIADAPSALSAQLAQAWAEYLPGPLPAEVLAQTAITGEHWSARFWANHADIQLSAVISAISAFEASVLGQIAAGQVTINSAVTVVRLSNLVPDGTLTSFQITDAATSHAAVPTASQELIVSLDGVLQRPETDFTVSSSTLTFGTAPSSDSQLWAVWIAPGAAAGQTDITVIDGGTF